MEIQIDEDKLGRQLKGVERWKSAKNLGISHSNGSGAWWYVTGMGKTFATCEVIKRILGTNNASIIYIGVPSEALEKQWKSEIKRLIPQCENNIFIKTAHELIKIDYQIQCTLLVIDELHEFYTDERIKILDGTVISRKYILGLTATYEDIHKRYKKIEHLIPVVDRIDEEEAMREGWISKYVEYNLEISLTEQERNFHKHHSDIIYKQMAKFGKNPLELAKKCLRGDEKAKPIGYCMAVSKHNGFRDNMDLTKKIDQEIYSLWHPNKVMAYAKSLMESIRERKNVLYGAYNKLIIAKEVVDKFNNLKAITFSQSTDFADKLAIVINKERNQPICTVYHSKIKTKIIYDEVKGKEIKKGKTVLKREAIEGIRNGRFRVISTASSLDRGFDVKDISLVLTTSGTQNPTQYDQRKGRGLRVDYLDKDNIVLIVNLYVKSTQDEKWLRVRQSKTKNVIYWVDNVNNINHIPKRTDVFNIDEF